MFNEPLNIAACSRIFFIVVYLPTNEHCSTKQNDLTSRVREDFPELNKYFVLSTTRITVL
jgi:hypothetical protein